MPAANIQDAETWLSRLGFMAGEFSVPDDFDQMMNDEFFDGYEADKWKRLGEGAKPVGSGVRSRKDACYSAPLTIRPTVVKCTSK